MTRYILGHALAAAIVLAFAVGFVVAIGLVVLVAQALAAQQHGLILHGKLFSEETDCHFFIDSDTDAPGIGLDASNSDALCTWLTGTANRAPVTLQLTPE